MNCTVFLTPCSRPSHMKVMLIGWPHDTHIIYLLHLYKMSIMHALKGSFLFFVSPTFLTVVVFSKEINIKKLK